MLYVRSVWQEGVLGFTHSSKICMDHHEFREEEMNKSACAILLALTFASAANAELVANSSFELPDINASLTDGQNPIIYRYERINANLLSGWNVEGTSIGLLDSVPGKWEADAGNQYINLESGFGAAISQSLATSPGQQYRLSFAYAADPFASGGSSDDALHVFWDGVLVDSVDESDTTLSDLSWTTHTYFLTATQSTTALRFADQAGVSFVGAYLDNVSVVSAVPVPAGVWLFGPALAAIGALRRRRRG